MIYNYTETSQNKTITLDFMSIEEDIPIVLAENHPKFNDINALRVSGELAQMDERDVLPLITLGSAGADTLGDWFDPESDEVNHSLFAGTTLNGMQIDPVVAKKISTILDGFDPKDEAHVEAVVAFMDRVEKHPQGIKARDFLAWASRNGINLTREGMVVGYKSVLKVSESDYARYFGNGVQANGDILEGLPPQAEGKAVYRPSHWGAGITDGVAYDEYIPMYVGAVVEMPRDKVDSSGSVACSVGLHVGNYDYASTFNQHREGATMTLVLVDPKDIVSVPDYAFDKYRVSRYTVIAEGIPGELDTHLWIDEIFNPSVEAEEKPEHAEYGDSEYDPERDEDYEDYEDYDPEYDEDYYGYDEDEEDETDPEDDEESSETDPAPIAGIQTDSVGNEFRDYVDRPVTAEPVREEPKKGSTLSRLMRFLAEN